MADNIHIKLPDGSVKELPKGSTALDVAKSIGQRLADAALAAKTNGDLIDLTRPLEKDTALRILTEKDPEALEVYRHSSAHLLAAAVLELFPETKLGHGPPTESGFFYDFYRPTPFTPEDLEKIEKKMQELVQQNIPYAREFLPRDRRTGEFKNEGDFMKCHFIEQFTKPDEKISIYTHRQVHRFLPRPAYSFDRENQGVQAAEHCRRLLAGRREEPATAADLRDFVLLEEGTRRFIPSRKRPRSATTACWASSSICFHPGTGRAGADLLASQGRNYPQEMEDWMRDEYIKRGYSLVYTPHVARRQLWQTSGHEGYYAQNMFDVMELDDAEYRLKPMNCPVPHSDLQGLAEVLSRFAGTAGRTGHGLSLRAFGSDARAAAGARLYPGRCAHFLHAGAD